VRICWSFSFFPFCPGQIFLNYKSYRIETSQDDRSYWILIRSAVHRNCCSALLIFWVIALLSWSFLLNYIVHKATHPTRGVLLINVILFLCSLYLLFLPNCWKLEAYWNTQICSWGQLRGDINATNLLVFLNFWGQARAPWVEESSCFEREFCLSTKILIMFSFKLFYVFYFSKSKFQYDIVKGLKF
jgi:hypothetical protein